MSSSLQEEVRRVLRGITPEADVMRLRSDVDLREQLDIDSMDLLEFVTALSKRFAVQVPEADTARLVTLDGCVAYLQEVGAEAR